MWTRISRGGARPPTVRQHAPAYLNRFRCAGSYGLQAHEAWHGLVHLPKRAARPTPSLEPACDFVRLAARERQPAAASALDKGQQRRSSAGSHVARRPSDKRLRANETGPRQTTVGKLKKLEGMRALARDRVKQAATKGQAQKMRLLCGLVPHTLSAGDESEFVPGAEGIDLAAIFA